ncbi:MAG TPA: hypothetical protein VHR86_10040 [Armatimonadota bacterium]|nr:hypothetical protein [Armatimonadota bacterium]
MPIYLNILVALAIITGLALGAWWIISLYSMHSRAAESRLKHVNLPADLEETIAGIPPALILFYLFTGIVMIAYVLYAWLGGVTY